MYLLQIFYRELFIIVQAFEYNSDGVPTAVSINYLTATATNNPNSQATTTSSPLITINPGSLSGFTYVAGAGPSASQSFTVSAINLTGAPGNIVVTAPADYEINDGSGWTSSFNIPYASATLGNTNVDVRLKSGLSVNTYNGESVSFAGGGDTKTATVNGSVTLGVTTANAVTSFTANSFTANWSPVVQATGYFLDVANSNTFVDATSGTVVGWNFEAGTNVASSGIAANAAKTISAVGVTNPTFNSSANGGLTARADGWDAGAGTKNWEIEFNTTSYVSLKLSSKQRASNTGPRDFKLQYKIGAGGTYADVPGGTVPALADNYTSGVINNLSLPAACENQSSVFIRWIVTSTTSVGGGTIATTGASNIDDIVITGTIPSTYVSPYQNFAVAGTSQVVTVPGPGTYYYRVRATNGVVTSGNSNVISVVMNDQNSSTFRSVTSGDYSNSGSWEFNVSPPSFFVASTQAPGSGNNVSVQNGHTITLTSPASANALTLGSTGNVILGANNLTVNSVTGGSAGGHIVTDGAGALTINNVGASTVTFPVGPSTSLYHPATINNAGTADNFSVKVSSSVAPCAPAATSVNATWDIAEAVAGGSNCAITLDYAGATTGVSYSASGAQVTHCAGAVSDYHNGTVTGTVASGSGFTNFSPFTVSNDLTVLPVSFGTVKAYQQNTVIKVEWTNLTESDMNGYVIERSADGRSFSSIGTVGARLNNGGKADYSFTDAAPLTGLNFYRIKAAEINGTAKLSTIVKVDTRAGNTDIVIYPNPVTNGQVALQASSLPKGVYTVRIFNANGQQVQSQLINHNGGSVTQAIALPATIKSGIYSLQVSGADLNMTKTFIVK